MISLIRPLMRMRRHPTSPLGLGLEPAVFGKDFGCCVGTLPVAFHDSRAFNLQLFHIPESNLQPRNRLTDRDRIVAVLAINRNNRRGFGQSVALPQFNAHGIVEAADGIV